MWWKKDEPKPFLSAVIPAAGNSSRMGNGVNKLLMELNGIPVLARTLLTFEQNPRVNEIIVVCREEDIYPYARLCESFGLSKVQQIVRGGDSRMQSVLCGIRTCSTQTQFVAIHDGARPLLQQTELDLVIRDAEEHGAACLLVPVKDSIKRLTDGFISGDVPRAALAAAQTPQVFEREAIQTALEQAAARGLSLTDDCAAAELVGLPVFATPGSYTNIKVTTPEDLAVAETFLREAEG